MSAAPQDRDDRADRDEPPKMPGSRARLWIVLAFVVVLVIVVGYMLLVGGLVGD